MQANPKFGNTVSFMASFCLALTINWQEAHFLWHPVGEFCSPVRHRTCSCHQYRKFRALWWCTSREKHLLVPCHQGGKQQNYQLFISIILPVSSWWCTFLWHETRNLFQIHKEALKSLADWLTSSSSLQNLIKTRDCTWSTKLLNFKQKLTYTKYLQKAHLARTVNAVFFLFVFILAFFFYRY